jgi:hypothetical protein
VSRLLPLLLVVALVAAAALALGNVSTAPAERRVHHLVRWEVYQREHRVSTKLGRRVRALRRHVRLLRVQLERARHVQAVRVVHVDSTDWRAKQIAAAETIARESSGDPWPSCPDPYDGSGGSWDDTVRCENGGSWLDSPGWYRCGLQFDPAWETRFGRLCP